MWLEVLAVAFVFQLAVLPGEKVQFVVAALSTRYDPRVVVAAAAASFAGWTVLEILFGRALQRLLPGAVLDGVTASLFLLFAVLLYRSTPGRDEAETDGGVADAVEPPTTLFGRDLPDSLGNFPAIFAMMAAGEFGDKTQLVTISLAVQYGAHPAIWAGEMLAIVPVTAANAYFFDRFAGRLNLRRAHLAAAALFAFFGLDTVLSLATGFSVWETVVGAVSEAVHALVV